ncbi:hypothetical protein ABT124_15815 [Streptomyces sp. NPDC001982]|uniref:hypothetical protein n=1 Tax=Streptomyces sp. NPDC001982 TaxID=3154405 RepID=UPI0033276D60
MTTPTPADMPKRPTSHSARTRMSLENVIQALADSIEADGDSIDLDAVVTLSLFVKNVAALTQAQADYTTALNVRHAQRPEGAK